MAKKRSRSKSGSKKSTKHLITEESLDKKRQGLEDIWEKYLVEDDEADFIWNAIEQFLSYQLQEKKGSFYEAAKQQGWLD